MSDYLTIKQIATLTGRSIHTVRDHARLGWLKASRFPGAQGLRVRRVDAEKWSEKYLAKVLPAEVPTSTATMPEPQPA